MEKHKKNLNKPEAKTHPKTKEPWKDRNSKTTEGYPDSVRPDNIPYSTSIEAHKDFCSSIGVQVNPKEAIKRAQEGIYETAETAEKDNIK